LIEKSLFSIATQNKLYNKPYFYIFKKRKKFMKIRYILLLSFLTQSLYPAEGERIYRTGKAAPVKEESTKIDTQAQPHVSTAKRREPKDSDRADAAQSKADRLYKGKGSSWFTSKEERKEKFKTKTAKLSADAQNIILELKNPSEIDSSKLSEMIQEINQAIANESKLSSFWKETSTEFARELQEAKIKLEQETNRRSAQAKETEKVIFDFGPIPKFIID
jgi:hypothetical protein